ncbi:MAG: CDP-archaeol synthase [Gammaproteobacteria bacterium]|nr:CDP-archaeol synthase [Gammaproteobacteria bacterium]
MTDLLLQTKLLLLLGVANGAPLFGHKAFRERFAWPLDGGARFFDGRPLLGPSKTIRGVALALLTTPLAALLLELDFHTGIVIAGFAMLGDLTSSFTKRRLGLSSSSQAVGVDQIPESLFPLLAVQTTFGLAALDVGVLVTVFLVLELAISRVLFKLRWRDQPY